MAAAVRFETRRLLWGQYEESRDVARGVVEPSPPLVEDVPATGSANVLLR